MLIFLLLKKEANYQEELVNARGHNEKHSDKIILPRMTIVIMKIR